MAAQSWMYIRIYNIARRILYGEGVGSCYMVFRTVYQQYITIWRIFYLSRNFEIHESVDSNIQIKAQHTTDHNVNNIVRT